MFRSVLCPLLFLFLIISGNQELFSMSKESSDIPDDITIEILSEEMIKLNNESVHIKMLKERLISFDKDHKTRIVIRVTGDVTMGVVYDVKKIIVQSGLTGVIIDPGK
jgi:biopolymer transport protein ExbD